MGNKLRVLNLYAGIGGNRKLWGENYDITAVENDYSTAEVYKTYFPNDTVVIDDAHNYLIENFKKFDFIWSSPPCPSHSNIRSCGVHSGKYDVIYPDMTLYQEIILLRHFAPKNQKWVVENVFPYYEPLIKPTKKLHRHYYWSNFNIGDFKILNRRIHNEINGKSNLYGFDLSNSNLLDKRKAFRNMVDPDLGEYILNCAIGSMVKYEQATLFT